MKRFLSLLAAAMLSILMMAQQNTGYRQSEITSPVVNNNHSVTFFIQAPKASVVRVLGDWEADGGVLPLHKGKDGLWMGTSPILPSEMYTYRVEIDGVIGLDPTNPFTRRDVGNVFNIFFISGGVADYYQVHDVPHGQLHTVWYPSKAANCERRLSIYTPAAYIDKQDMHFPVLYLLHGSGGDETAWVELGNTVRIMDNMIAEGKIEPMIVVMPNGNFSVQAAPGETSANLDFRPVMSNRIPGNYKNGLYETSFDEIISFVDEHYRTIPEKKSRAIAGLSMGGFHTLFIALNHPDKFQYVALFSAGLNTKGLDMDLPAYSDIDSKLNQLFAEGCSLFWIGIGKDDFLYEANRDFVRRMEGLRLPYVYHESTRGHLWCNWRQYLVEYTQKIFR